MHWNGVGFKAGNGVNNFIQVGVIESVVELLIDVSQVREVELAFSMSVEQDEVSLSTFFCKRITLNVKKKITIFLVSSVIKPSKSRAFGWLASSISTRAL